jgi:hypothetical protein
VSPNTERESLDPFEYLLHTKDEYFFSKSIREEEKNADYTNKE